MGTICQAKPFDLLVTIETGGRDQGKDPSVGIQDSRMRGRDLGCHGYVVRGERRVVVGWGKVEGGWVGGAGGLVVGDFLSCNIR